LADFDNSCVVYLEKAFDCTGFRSKERLPNAKGLGDTSLMFLVHPTLKKEEVDFTCRIIDEVMVEASIE
jgi:dTDP-4-amino-4,6-dideoxygalactose transaminase